MSEETIQKEITAETGGQSEQTSESALEAGDNSKETSKASGESASTQSPSLGWWDVSGLKTPEEFQDRVKKIQAEYTRTAQEAKRLKKQAESTVLLEGKVSEYENLMRQSLESPDVYNAYRRQYMSAKGITVPSNGSGNGNGSVQNNSIPKIETQEDLFKYLESRENAIRDSVRNELRQEYKSVLSEFAQPIMRDRWSNAENDLRNKYPGIYDEHALEVKKAIASGPFGALTQTKGMDEKRVLEAAFLALYPEEVADWHRKNAVSEVHKTKQTATTEKARKFTQSRPTDKPLSTDEIVAELRSSGFSFQR